YLFYADIAQTTFFILATLLQAEICNFCRLERLGKNRFIQYLWNFFELFQVF
ncbi:MAG: hypothetical protein RI894_1270, partial [Bacteroidota bacterium]